MSLPPHSWHFTCATSSFTGSVRQDPAAHSWNENENWRCSTHTGRHMVQEPIFPPKKQPPRGRVRIRGTDLLGKPVRRPLPACSGSLWASSSSSAQAQGRLSRLDLCLLLSTLTRSPNFRTFLGSSVNRKVCCWFFWWLLFSGLHIRPGGVRLDFQKVFLSLPFWVRSFVKLWIPLLHPLSRVNYYSTPPLPSGLWVSMFGWIISHGKKKMLIMPLTPGSSVPSAPFSTLHREVFFSSIFCFEELPNSPLVCCVLIFHSC